MSFVRIIALAFALCAALPAAAQDAEKKDNIAGPYVPTPWVIVDEMLKLAGIRADDMVYDLGSGDGRLVIAAAKRYGARGVGIELQPELVAMANEAAKKEGVADRVKFIQGDLFETDIREATVVTLYLLPRFVTRLAPRFRAELKPGTRIVSHDYPLSPWKPDKDVSMDVPEKELISGTAWTRLYYYVVPARR
jgi:SAM-dependent methyltransferase